MTRQARLIILALCLRYDNDWDKVYNSIVNKDDVSQDEYEAAANFGGNFVCILDENYPDRFKHTTRPPFVFFYEGDINLLKAVDFYPNPYIFLYGENRFNIPQKNLCLLTDDGKIDIAGGLKVWEKLNDASCYLMPTRICNSIACCNRYSKDKGPKTKFGSIIVPISLMAGCDIYMIPTSGPSYNNDLIDEGAILLDSADRIKVLQPEMPF